MFKLPLAAAAFAMFATAAVAQTRCEALFAAIPLPFDRAPENALKVQQLADGCAADHVVLNLGNYQRWTIGRLTITGFDPSALAAKTLPPAATLTATDLSFTPTLATALSAYIIAVQQRPFDVHLSYRHDDKTKVLQLDAGLAGAFLGTLDMHITVSGVPPLPRLDASEPPNLAHAALTAASLRLDNRDIVETFAVPPLVGLLGPDADPVTEVPLVQAGAIAALRALPIAASSDAPKDALARFIGDFPHPTGRFEASIAPQRPVLLDDLLALRSPPEIIALLGRLRLAATYAAAP